MIGDYLFRRQEGPVLPSEVRYVDPLWIKKWDRRGPGVGTRGMDVFNHSFEAPKSSSMDGRFRIDHLTLQVQSDPVGYLVLDLQ